MGIIELENVSFRYEADGRTILKDLSLSVEEGEFLCVLGHNGCGKSTMAKLMNGLLTPSSGRVLVKGMDTADESRLLAIRACAGMVFQNPDNQMVATVVEEDVAFGPENLGVPREELRTRVDRALESVNMSSYASSSPQRLSGGQKQRIAIAGILAMQPEILIMDESTSMLDPRGRQEVLETARRLNREKHITVIFITHFMEETVEADRLVVMDNGRIAAVGTPKEIFKDKERIRELSLELPCATRLADRLGLEGVLTEADLCEALWRSKSKN